MKIFKKEEWCRIKLSGSLKRVALISTEDNEVWYNDGECIYLKFHEDVPEYILDRKESKIDYSQIKDGSVVEVLCNDNYIYIGRINIQCDYISLVHGKSVLVTLHKEGIKQITVFE